MEKIIKKKLLMLCAASQNIYTFRLPLIKRLEREGFEVYAVAFDDDYKNELKAERVRFMCLKGSNRSSNPLKILSLKKHYRQIIDKVKPDVVFTFVLKPNTFGVLAAHEAGVTHIFSMVEGAGDPFTLTGLKWRVVKKVVCSLYKKSFKYPDKVFFLNQDDAKEFAELGLVKHKQSQLVFGIGVDTERFAETPVDVSSNQFVMMARMQLTKGVIDYCNAARLVKQSHPEAEFLYLGGESSLKVSDIQEYIDDGSIKYLGVVKDVRPELKASLMMCMPSYYREGMSMSIMEALSSGRGVITTDNIGCRDMVREGYNGYIIDKHDYKALADRCIKVLEDKALAEQMGKNAREYAVEHLEQSKINEKIVGVLQQCIIGK